MAVIDSYSEANADSSSPTIYSGSYIYRGQSFTSGGNYTLVSAQIYGRKVGSPTGNIYGKIYSHSGVYGTSSIGDALLATSDALDVSTITGTDATLIIFTFSGAQQITLNSDYYCLLANYEGGDASNKVEIWQDTSSPTHSGNQMMSLDGTAWEYNNLDISFYIYGTLITEYNISLDKGALTLTGKNSVFGKGISMLFEVGQIVLTGISSILEKKGIVWSNIAQSGNISPDNTSKNSITAENSSKNSITPDNQNKT